MLKPYTHKTKGTQKKSQNTSIHFKHFLSYYVSITSGKRQLVEMMFTGDTENKQIFR